MPTNNKGLNQPALGSTGWGTPINDNATILDRALGSFTTISDVSGNVSLTLAQTQNMCIKSTTSAFLADVTFIVPSGVAGQWVVVNQSASNVYNLIVKNAASVTSVSIPNGQTRTVYSDGTIVFFVDTQSPSVLQNLAIGNSFATASATCVSTNATITFSGGYLIAVGQTISVKGVTPAGYNGIWTVTASSAGSVTFVVPSALGSQTVAGTLYYGAITGSTLDLSGKGAVSGVATQAEAAAATDNQTLMTPLRTSQAVGVANSPMVKTALNASGNPPIYGVRAWGNFTGSGSGGATTIYGSGNIASIVWQATGRWAVTFTTPMPDGGYSVTASAMRGLPYYDVFVSLYGGLGTTGFQLLTLDQYGGLIDNVLQNVCFQVVR
jgi:hypothetical protein